MQFFPLLIFCVFFYSTEQAASCKNVTFSNTITVIESASEPIPDKHRLSWLYCEAANEEQRCLTVLQDLKNTPTDEYWDHLAALKGINQMIYFYETYAKNIEDIIQIKIHKMTELEALKRDMEKNRSKITSTLYDANFMNRLNANQLNEESLRIITEKLYMKINRLNRIKIAILAKRKSYIDGKKIFTEKIQAYFSSNFCNKQLFDFEKQCLDEFGNICTRPISVRKTA